MAEIPPLDRNEPRYSDEEVDEIIAGRATIEQAKGVLMHIYDVDAEQAFKMLKSHSRTNHMKLRQLAQRLLDSPTLARDLWH